MKLYYTTRNFEQKPCTTIYLQQVEKAYYGTNMVSLRKDHAPLFFFTNFVLISFNILIYMPTYRPYPITIFARETNNQVEVA